MEDCGLLEKHSRSLATESETQRRRYLSKGRKRWGSPLPQQWGHWETWEAEKKKGSDVKREMKGGRANIPGGLRRGPLGRIRERKDGRETKPHALADEPNDRGKTLNGGEKKKCSQRGKTKKKW